MRSCGGSCPACGTRCEEWRIGNENLYQKNKSLEAENACLRKALERILVVAESPRGSIIKSGLAKLARAALSEGKE